MKKLRPFLAILLVIANMVAFTPQVSASTQPRKVLTGWIPYYSMSRSLPAVVANVDIIREVMPFWYTLKYNGAKKLPVVTDLYAPANPSVPIDRPLATLRSAGFTIIPTITDGTSELVLSKLLANPVSRTQVVNAIVELVMKYNYDGIDLDFEGFAFVYAWAEIAPYIDRLRIMTYDFSVAKPGPLGPLAWTERTIKYAISVMPASKVYVGIPGYGRDWVTKVEGTCPKEVANVVRVGAKAATFVLRDAAALAQSYGVVPTYDETLGEVNFTYSKTYSGQTANGLATTCTATRTAWYQDARSFTSRIALVSKYRLGGVAQWTFGMEDMAASQAIRSAALAIAPDQVISTIESSTGSIESAEALEFGSIFGLKASFQLPDKLPISNLLVRIETKAANESQWREIATSTTGADGIIQVPLLLSKSSMIRARTDATWERLESISAEVSVVIARRISVSAPVSAVRSQPLQITGTIAPRQSGVPLQLLQQRAGKWIPVGSPVLTDVNGLFTISTTVKQKGFAKYMVRVAKDAQWNQADSEVFTVVIR